VREEVGKRKEREERRKGRKKRKKYGKFSKLEKIGEKKKDNLWNWYKIYFCKK
jgi:hypothetical protein